MFSMQTKNLERRFWVADLIRRQSLPKKEETIDFLPPPKNLLHTILIQTKSSQKTATYCLYVLKKSAMFSAAFFNTSILGKYTTRKWSGCFQLNPPP